MLEPIPVTASPQDWTDINHIPSPLIEVLENHYFIIDMKYPGLGFNNAVNKCYMREEVINLLIQASKALPDGICLKILDAWRPFALQEELYEVYSKQLFEHFLLSDKSVEEQKIFINRYIAEPTENILFPPVHTTGGAIDVTLSDKNGNELPMGTEFDDFSPRAHTAFFENTNESTYKENRRLLYHTLTSVGFTNLPSEWWHYDYGNRYWAYYNKKPALYRGIFTEKEI